MLLLKADAGSTALHEALLEACSVNDVYDRQCEDSRETYLHKLIIASGAQAFFRRALLEKLNGATHTLQGDLQEAQMGLAQIFAILCLMAAKDEDFDRHDLYAFFDKIPEDLAQLCLSPMVQLEGMDGLLRCVRRIHDEVVADYDQNGWIFHSLIETLAERDGAEIASQELQQARGEVAELDRILVLKEAAPLTKTKREIIDYATFKEKLDTTGRTWGGRDFTDVELIEASNDLLNQHEISRLRAYLNIFRLRRFALPAVNLLPLLQHEDLRVAGGATVALGNLKDEIVREAAFSAFRDGKLAQAVQLLKSNYQMGDFAVIEAELTKAKLDHAAFHALGSAVLNLAENDPLAATEANAMLVKLYMSGRCSLCRRSAVKLLAKFDAIPDWMVQELPFDVYSDMAEIGRSTPSALPAAES